MIEDLFSLIGGGSFGIVYMSPHKTAALNLR
jgi:hypothetical protein